jgi:hypothetical protein
MKAIKLKQSEKEKYLKVIYDAWFGIGDFTKIPASVLNDIRYLAGDDYDWSFARDASDSAIDEMYCVCVNYLFALRNASKGRITKTNKKENK